MDPERFVREQLDFAIGRLRQALDHLTQAIAEIEPGVVHPEPVPPRPQPDADDPSLFVVPGKKAKRIPSGPRPSHRY